MVDRSKKTGVGKIMRGNFVFAKIYVCRAKIKRILLRDHAQASGRPVNVVAGPPLDGVVSISFPELQSVAVRELDHIALAQTGRRHPQEFLGKQGRRWLVEAPVRQRDARVDRLQLPFEVE